MPLWDCLRSKLTSGQVKGPATSWWSCHFLVVLPNSGVFSSGVQTPKEEGGQGIISTCHSEDRPPPRRLPGVVGACLVVIRGCGRVCLATISEKMGSEVETGSCPAPGPGPSSSAHCALLAPWGRGLVLFSTPYRLK